MIDNKNEEFPIVDEMGNILGAVTRGHAHDGSKILHPVVHLHVFNSRGDLYLQHRPAWKDIQPDKLGYSLRRSCRFRRKCESGFASRGKGRIGYH